MNKSCGEEYKYKSEQLYNGRIVAMDAEIIEVSMENGKLMDVVVYSKRDNLIEVVLGEGVHSVKCELKPTKNGSAYVGNIMGREIIYNRSTAEIKEDLDKANLDARNSLSVR
jgi:hypothetical protein